MFRKISIAFVLITALAGEYRAAAATYTWTGAGAYYFGDYSWNDFLNWTESPATYAYPGYASGDVAVFPNGGTYAANAPVLNSTLPYSLSSITVNNAANTLITVNSGYTLKVTGGMNIGSYSPTLLTFAGAGTTNVTGTSTFNYLAGLQINTGATVTFNTSPGFNGPPSFSNSGTLNIINCSFPYTSYNYPAPVINSSGIINITGTSSSLSTNLGVNNSGAINLTTGGSLILNNTGASLQNTGTIISNTGNLSMIGSGTYITNSNTIKATATTFTFGNGNYIKNNASASFTTQAGCIFNATTSGSYISNAGTWTDHASTYNLTGQSVYFVNSSTAKLRGTTVNLGVSGGGSNAQYISNSSIFTADSASVINAPAYGSYITNSGTFTAGTSGSSCIISLSAQNTYLTNSSIFNLGSTSIVYPSGYTSNITNQSAGTFTLMSDANGSAAIGALNSTATCTGTFNVQKYYQGSGTYSSGRWIERNYRTISSPVNTGTQVNSNYVYGLNYLAGSTAGQTTAASSTTNAFVTGATGGSTSAGNPTLYLYRENIAPSNTTFTSGNFRGLTNIATPSALGTSDAGNWTIPTGNGVFFFFRGNATSFTARTNLPFIAPENVTFTQTGLINQQSVTVKNWYTPTSSNIGYTTATANTAVRGFNLVGNPYPCSIDWNTSYSGTGITRPNVNPAIYEFNPITSQYNTYITTSPTTGIATGTASNIITSGQGFFVQANATNASLVFTEAAKSAPSQLTGTSLLFAKRLNNSVVPAAAEQSLRLQLSLDSLNNDDIYIGFNKTASAGYNVQEDALFLPGINAPEGLSSASADGKPLAINFLPLPKLKPQVIKLSVAAKESGLYRFEKTGLTGIPDLYEIWLMDSNKKDSLDLKHNNSYAFDINVKDTTTYGSNRFSLVIRQNPALGVHLLSFTALKAATGALVKWDTENEADYTSFTVQRSTDNGITFSSLGNFMSDYLSNYKFTDTDPAKPSDEYRLMLTDLNGNNTYSNVVTLSYGNQDNVPGNISVYPNPASNMVNLSINTAVNTSGSLLNTFALNAGTSAANLPSAAAVNTNVTNAVYAIKITSMTGAVLKTVTSTTANWQENVSSYMPGTYIIQVINNKDNSLIGKGTFVKL